jgi:pilus assembly protein CpaB
MKNRRAVLLFGLAMLFALGAAFTARQVLQTQNAGTEQVTIETVPVVVARVDLEAGASLRVEQLELIDWPKQYALAGINSSGESLDSRVLKRPISAGEPVLASALVPEGSQAGLVSVIDEQRRAVSVKVDPVIGVAGFVAPGSRVDVLATLQRVDGKRRQSYSKVILQDVSVLAVDQKMETATSGDPELVSVVTLSVTPVNAQKLIYSAHEGRLQLALRGPGDSEVVKTKSVTAVDLLGERRRKVRSKPRLYVQVLSGSKMTTKSF